MSIETGVSGASPTPALAANSICNFSLAALIFEASLTLSSANRQRSSALLPSFLA